MVRYHPYARRRLRKLFWQWVRADLVRTLAFVVGAIVLIAFETSMLLILDLDDRLRWYLVGLVPAVIVALAVGGLFSGFPGTRAGGDLAVARSLGGGLHS